MKKTKAANFRAADRELALNLASTAIAVEAIGQLLTAKRWRWPWQPVFTEKALLERIRVLAEERSKP